MTARLVSRRSRASCGDTVPARWKNGRRVHALGSSRLGDGAAVRMPSRPVAGYTVSRVTIRLGAYTKYQPHSDANSTVPAASEYRRLGRASSGTAPSVGNSGHTK